MNSPVYSLDYKETIGSAKNMMKEKNASRLLITKNSFPYGVISTLDLAASILTPKGRQRKEMIPEIKNSNEKLVEEIVRDGFVTIKTDTTLYDAVKKLVEKKVSSLVILEDKKAVGVVSASDVFKIVRSQIKDKIEINVSGLSDEEDQYYYDINRARLENVFEKFKKSLDIKNIHLHIKKGKSVYEFKLNASVNGKNLSISAEEHNFHDTMKKLVYEINTILRKKGDEHKRSS